MSGFYDLPFFSTTNKSSQDGKDGISPTITVTNITNGHQLEIVDATGTKTINIMNGAAGPQGIQGERGPAGEQGPKGDTGIQGPIGLTGPEGPQGIQGETGPAGKDGTNGTNGKSAYQYAQDGNFQGTEADFAALLANVTDKRNITLGVHTDGLLYIFINGEPAGTGISPTITPEI